jgi:hypothetical protein
MKLKHRFWTANTPAQGFWAQEVFKDVYSLQKLENNLQKVAFPQNPADLNGHDPFSMVLGDGWEGFFEIVGKVFGIHPDLRIVDIVSAPPGQQGFDFVAVHTKTGEVVTIQCKYIGKSEAWAEELRENEKMKLERYLKASQNEAGVPVEATDNMIVFTNAKGIDYFTSEVLLYDKVRCIGRPQITYLVDKNPAFWDTARKMITDTNPYIGF